MVDADERVTPELKTEIQKILSSETIPYDAFWIYRRNYFMGKEIKYSGWQEIQLFVYLKEILAVMKKNMFMQK
ncbi:MAG: hypothetical protein IPH42_21790 [Bacteroidetes bacterium]|nr:hypothetical protein [Bacteroidota bacterium]